MSFEPKKLFFKSFSKTLSERQLFYYSFFPDITPEQEIELLFSKLIEDYGSVHRPIYRLCDAEYMYTMGVKIPKLPIPLKSKITSLVSR